METKRRKKGISKLLSCYHRRIKDKEDLSVKSSAKIIFYRKLSVRIIRVNRISGHVEPIEYNGCGKIMKEQSKEVKSIS